MVMIVVCGVYLSTGKQSVSVALTGMKHQKSYKQWTGWRPTQPTHSNYWLLGNTNSETTSNEDLFQAQTYQALEDYHTHQKWKETEDPGRSYKILGLTGDTPERMLRFKS